MVACFSSFFFHNNAHICINFIHISETMSQTSQDSLETLRQRAKCPVCLTFFIKPKKLNDCSHVLCLNCLKQHLQNSNFPPCPECRKPMIQPLSEIDKYEPARAEEDVADFVRQFQMCDVCNKPENPNLRCLQCYWFICENCLPCHRRLKPMHVTELIINSNRDPKKSKNLALFNENSGHDFTMFFINASRLCLFICLFVCLTFRSTIFQSFWEGFLGLTSIKQWG